MFKIFWQSCCCCDSENHLRAHTYVGTYVVNTNTGKSSTLESLSTYSGVFLYTVVRMTKQSLRCAGNRLTFVFRVRLYGRTNTNTHLQMHTRKSLEGTRAHTRKWKVFVKRKKWKNKNTENSRARVWAHKISYLHVFFVFNFKVRSAHSTQQFNAYTNERAHNQSGVRKDNGVINSARAHTHTQIGFSWCAAAAATYLGEISWSRCQTSREVGRGAFKKIHTQKYKHTHMRWNDAELLRNDWNELRITHRETDIIGKEQCWD